MGDMQGGWEIWNGRFLGSASGIVIKELQPYAISFRILETDSEVTGVHISTTGSGVPNEPNMRIPVKYLYPTLFLKGSLIMDWKIQGGNLGDFKARLLVPGMQFKGRLFASETEIEISDYYLYYKGEPSWKTLEVYSLER